MDSEWPSKIYSSFLQGSVYFRLNIGFGDKIIFIHTHTHMIYISYVIYMILHIDQAAIDKLFKIFEIWVTYLKMDLIISILYCYCELQVI